MRLVSSNSWHYSWPAIPERRQILQVWWPQRVKEQAAKDYIQHPSNRLHFKALEAYPGELLRDQPELGVKPPTSMKVFTHKNKHSVLDYWSGTQEWHSREPGLPEAFPSENQHGGSSYTLMLLHCTSCDLPRCWEGLSTISRKIFLFFCIIDFYLAWLVCWLPICTMSWVPFLNACLVEVMSCWKCWTSAGKGKGNSYLPRQKLHLKKRIVYLWFLFLYTFILPVFRKEFNYSNFIPNVLINKFDLT